MKAVSLVPLNGKDYPTWKVQCRMTPVKWPLGNRQFLTRKDRALATIVLSIELSLLYLLGNPENPVEEAQRSLPEEDMGKQAGAAKKAVSSTPEGRRIS